MPGLARVGPQTPGTVHVLSQTVSVIMAPSINTGYVFSLAASRSEPDYKTVNIFKYCHDSQLVYSRGPQLEMEIFRLTT